jgi:hypothetical protein
MILVRAFRIPYNCHAVNNDSDSKAADDHVPRSEVSQMLLTYEERTLTTQIGLVLEVVCPFHDENIETLLPQVTRNDSARFGPSFHGPCIRDPGQAVEVIFMSNKGLS